MTTFYDDPAIIAQLLGNRQNPPPNPGDKLKRLAFSGRFLFCEAPPASRATWMLAGEFRCQCGSVGFYRLTAVEQEHTTSCGCLRSESTTKRNQAAAIHPPHLKKIFKAVYFAWKNMNRRCYDPDHEHWHNYGGRGITVCEEWRSNFHAFLSWAYENNYRPHLSIERIDNNGNYEPGNCKWANGSEQGRNRRTNRIVTAWGETKCVAAWMEDPRVTVNYVAVYNRIARGVKPEVAFTHPIIRGRPKSEIPLTDL